MTLEKLTIPLTITASVIGIIVFLRGQNKTPITGALPLSLTVPTFSNVPVSNNIATPTPPPVQTSSIPLPYVPYYPSRGVVIGGGLGAQFSSDSSATATDVNNNGCCCNSTELDSQGSAYPFSVQISQSAIL